MQERIATYQHSKSVISPHPPPRRCVSVHHRCLGVGAQRVRMDVHTWPDCSLYLTAFEGQLLTHSLRCSTESVCMSSWLMRMSGWKW
jgi:hypothetical protein